MEKFIIIGDKGSTFTHCEIDKLNQQVTYNTKKEAEKALKEIQLLFDGENFRIEQVR